MPILKYYNLHSSLLDLGLFEAEFFGRKYLDGSNRATLNHFQPILFFYKFIVDLFPVQLIPFILLFLQSFAMSLPILFFRSLSNYVFLALLAYILFFPVWFNLLFDFHFDHLTIVILSAYFLSLNSNRMGLAVFFAITLVTVKEPYALQTSMCGIYMMIINWSNNRKNISINFANSKNIKVYLYGLGLFVFGIGYFYLATNYIIPYYSSGKVNWFNSDAFSWMGSSLADIFLYILSHPVQIIIDIVQTPGKFFYLFTLLGALAFIPLLKPGPLIIALPILAISLLSEHEGYFGIGHQYTAGLIAPLLFAFIGGLPRALILWKKFTIGRFKLRSTWFSPILIIVLIATHISLAPSPIGRVFWSEKIWAYNYKAYIPSKRDSMIKNAISEHIPFNYDVIVSVQNTLNWGPLVQRNNFLVYPYGVNEIRTTKFNEQELNSNDSQNKILVADFVVLDFKRPWFIVDRGCEWYYGKCTNIKVAREFLEWYKVTKKNMQTVFEDDKFIILKRKE